MQSLEAEVLRLLQIRGLANVSKKLANNGNTTATALPRFFLISDVANFLKVSTRTVRRWIKDELLVAHRLNGLVRISETDLEAFLVGRRDD